LQRGIVDIDVIARQVGPDGLIENRLGHGLPWASLGSGCFLSQISTLHGALWGSQNQPTPRKRDEKQN
jgi:hypothetical protein